MAWISFSSSDVSTGAEPLVAFESVYPNAVVVVSENDVSRCALDYKANGVFVKIDALEHIVVTEYRGLTRAAAEYLKGGVAGNGKLMLKFTYSDSFYNLHVLNCPALVGTERQCAISRANDADGYLLTVTESTTGWDTDIPTTANYVSAGGAGTSFGTIPKGDVFIRYGANA